MLWPALMARYRQVCVHACVHVCVLEVGLKRPNLPVVNSFNHLWWDK